MDSWWMHGLWVIATGAVGFGITALAAGRLKLRRRWVVLVYAVIGGAFLSAYFAWAEIDLVKELRQRWPLGLAGAVIVGFSMVRNVASQPASPRSEGAQLVYELLWCGGLSHAAMHIAAVLHGMETTIQLPPHLDRS